MTDRDETSTRVDVDPEDVIFVPPGVRASLRAIAEAHACPYDDVAEAFRTLRPETADDAEAIGMVGKLAETDPTQIPELATAAVGMLRAKERAVVRRFETEHGVTLVIPSGAKQDPLPPERAFDGTPDPELGRMVAEGEKRYHLDTLKELDAESRAPAEKPKRRVAHTISPILALSTIAAMVGLPLSEVVEVVGADTEPAPGLPGSLHKLHAIEAEKAEAAARLMDKVTAGYEFARDRTLVAIREAEEKRARKAAKRLAEACRAKPRT